MREEEPNWFSKWEDDLPSPDELTPLSQTLISPDLALAFNIVRSTPLSPTHTHTHTNTNFHHHRRRQHTSPPPPPPPPPHHPDFDSSSPDPTTGTGTNNNNNNSSGGGSGGEEPARTLKRPRLVWTPQLHKRFVDAVAQLGIKNAVPKTIMQLMSVDGLTRENVASHLQKYRLYLKRMQGLGGTNNSSAAAVAAAAVGFVGSGDSATDHLFASSPVPAHFLHQGGGGNGVGGGRGDSDRFLPYVQPAVMHQQMAVVGGGRAAAGVQGQYHHRQIGHFGTGQGGVGGGGQFEGSFLTTRQGQVGMMQSSGTGGGGGGGGGGYMGDLETGAVGSGRRVLTLFPTGDDD